MIKDIEGIKPNIHKDTFIAENASVIGDVNIGEGSSIWYNAVLRGDIQNIGIGKYSNIQDNASVHTGYKEPTKLGDYTVVGHNAIIHGCTIGDNCLIGMGSIILNGAKVGDNCIIGAGTIVTEGKVIPANSLVMGVPGKIIREVKQEEVEAIKNNAIEYNELYKKHL
ncbi:MAG: gamma carbonic anhydrase family protein [Tissierella sp.]|uniref:gamma carbonic anhydrase family protein n=1 Tax=Tissierella sp. TaxID=41274 RepID=UPI003F974A4A